MAENKLEFRINLDNNSKEVNLNEMSLEVTKAFVVLIQSVAKIVELTPENKDLKICVKKGSAVISIEGPSVESVEQEYRQVIEQESSHKQLVEEWRRIQTLFSRNGIHYEANFYSNDKQTSILEELKSYKKLRTKRKERPPVDTKVVFLTGRLIAVGGKIPNIHIERSDGEKVTIACTELKANKAKAFLYNKIWLSVWLTKANDSEKYEMCDSYWEKQLNIFDNFSSFIFELKESRNEIESLKLIHYKCQEILKAQEYGIFRKFLRLFNTDKTDINVLKTLLIASRPFQDQEHLSPILSELKTIFNRKIERSKNNILK